MAEAAAVLSQQIVQELLSASATALGTAFIGGALGAALLLRAGLLGWVLGRFTVRSIVVTRNPALSEAVDAHSPPDTVGAVDPAWARKRGIVALSSYFQQLEVAEGDREQWAESALLALLQGMGFGALAETSAGMLLAALPIGSILPASVNPAAGSHPLAATAAKAALDPLTLAAAARALGCPVGTPPPAELLMTGGEPADATPSLGLAGKSVVRLPEDLRLVEAAAFAEVTAKAAAATADTRSKSKDATPISSTLLPDLCTGSGGMMPLYTPRQEFRNRYLAALLNRLASNRLPEGSSSSSSSSSIDGQPFTVEMGKFKHVTSPGALLQAIADSSGSSLEGRFQSQIANFGVNLCIRCEKRISFAPFCI